MKEAYVSYKIAKLLKERGFPQSTSICNVVYKPNGKMSFNAKSFINPHYFFKDCYIFAPTQQMACRWLREMKNIDIEPFVYSNHHDGSKDYGCNIQKNGHLLMTESFVQDTYEEAVEAAVKYCLNELI